MPGIAGLIEEIDKKQQVVLRDGRVIIGYLRSVDQFANLLLNEAVERIHVGKMFADDPLGFFIIRGENVLLLGELDPDVSTNPEGLEEVSIEKIKEEQKKQREEKKEQEKIKKNALRSRGLENDENDEEI